jgi:AcrR family transcriptional regulator
MVRRKRPLRKIAQPSKKRGTKARARSARPAHGLRGTKPEPNAERRSSRVHDAVLAAASRLIRRYGYNRVTIEAIAAAAGAGKQTIYRWWPSKAALCVELYTSLATQAKLTVNTGTVGGDLRAFLRRVFRLFRTTPAKAVLAGLIAEAPHDRSVARALIDHLVRRRRPLIRQIFERGQARGEVRRSADLDVAVDAISSAVWFRLLLGHAPLDRRFAERLVAQVLRGVAAR